jgi:transposase
VIDRLLPDPAWLTGKGGRREVHCRRAVVDAIFYVVDNGIKWRALPVDFPPWSTVYNYFAAWEAAGVTQTVLDSLRDRVRVREGRAAQPTRHPPRRSSIPPRSRQPRPSVPRPVVSTPGRRSMAVNATSWWTRWVCCCASW